MRCSHASTGASRFQVAQALNAFRKASCVQSSAAAASPSIDARVRRMRGYVASYRRSKSDVSFGPGPDESAADNSPDKTHGVARVPHAAEGWRAQPRVVDEVLVAEGRMSQSEVTHNTFA